MTIEQKILSKLEPHAKRIRDGEGNDFDYLPAVLLQLMEEQKRQAKLLNDNANLLVAIKSAADIVGLQSKDQVRAYEFAAQSRTEQIETAFNNLQVQLQNTQSSMSEKIAMLTSKHSAHATRTDESLSEISLQVETIGSDTRRFHTNFIRLLIAGLIASTVLIGLTVAILQKH